MPDSPDVPADKVMQTCAANHVRMAARSVTRVFDRALRPCGLKVTQFTILMALAHDSFTSITEMADQLALKRSSLSRNLSRLEEKGFLATETEGRSRRTTLTRDGRAKVEEAYPLWRKAQSQVEQHLGADRWSEVRALLRSLARINASS
jgi:DNA-binding MarR family transcriptional regulator